jgi:hypothetical protein
VSLLTQLNPLLFGPKYLRQINYLSLSLFKNGTGGNPGFGISSIETLTRTDPFSREVQITLTFFLDYVINTFERQCQIVYERMKRNKNKTKNLVLSDLKGEKNEI